MVRFSENKWSYQLILLMFMVCFVPLSCMRDEYRNGMVVCAYPDAAKVGLDVLKKGGNAVDAAVAVQFALTVTVPEAGNIGGGGFMVYRSASGGTSTLDFSEKAPSTASQDMFLDSNGKVIPGKSISTHQASGVPAGRRHVCSA